MSSLSQLSIFIAARLRYLSGQEPENCYSNVVGSGVIISLQAISDV
jgi:hypothetical protein